MKIVVPYTNTLIGYITPDEFIYLENNFSTVHNPKPNQIEVQFKHLCQIHPVFDFDNKTVDYHFEIPYVEPIPDNKKNCAIFHYGDIKVTNNTWSNINTIKLPGLKGIDLLFRYFLENVYHNYRQEQIEVIPAFRHYLKYLGQRKFGAEFSQIKKTDFDFKFWDLLGSRYYNIENSPLITSTRDSTCCCVCMNKFGEPNLAKHPYFICTECKPKLKGKCPLCRHQLKNCISIN